MELNKYIDHTMLKAYAQEKDIIKLCDEADKYKFKSVCINPCYISLVKSYLEKLKRLYELMEIKYQDLLHALNTGKIDQKEFLEGYSKLRELQGNSIAELNTSNETLHQHTR